MSPLNPLYDHLDSSSTTATQTTTSDLTDLLNIIRNENSHKKEKVDRFLRHLCVLIQIILGYREVTRSLHKTSRWYREFVCQLDGAKDLLKHLGFADAGELLSPPTEHQYNLRQFTKIEPVAPFFQSNTDVLDHTSPSSINRETTGLSNHPPQGSLSTSFSHHGTSPLRSAMNAARSLRMTPGAVMSPRGGSFLHQERVHQQVKPAPSLTGQLPPRGSAARLSSENKQLQKKLHNLEAQIHDIVIANEELEQENKRRRVAEHELHSAQIKYEQINEAYIMTQHKNTELETECGRLQDILTRDRQFYMLGLMGDKRTPFLPGHPYEKQFDDPDELNSVVYPHSFDHGTLVEGDEDDDELEDELHGHSAGSLERMRKKKSVPDEVERPLAPFGGLQQEILNGWRKTRKRNKELEQESNECQETIRELEKMVSKLKKSRTSAEREVKLLRRTLKSRHGKMRGPTKTRENEEATSTDSTLDGDTTDEKGNGKSDRPLSSDDGGQVDPSLFHEALAQPKRPPPKVSQLTASVRKRQRELKEQEGKFAPNGQKPARKRAQSTETNSPSEERELTSRQNKRKHRKSKSGRTNRSCDSSEWNEHYYHDPSDDPEDLDAREMAANVPTKATRGNVPADLLNKRSRQKNRTRPPKPQKQPKLHKTKNRTKMNGAGGNAKQQKKEDLYIDRVSPKKPTTNPNMFEQSQRRQKEIETHGRLIEKIIRKDELLQHERTKNRELRNTVTEVYHRQWSADNKLNILGTPQKLRGIHLGNSVPNHRHRKDSHSQSSLEEIGIERDCVLRLFSHDRTSTRIRVCVNDDEFQDIDAFVVEDDGLSLIRDIVSPLTRNCLENGGTSLLCVCVGIKKVDVGLLSPKLRGVVKIILEDVLVKKEVTMTQFDSVLKSWNASEEKRNQQEDVLETLMVSSSEAQTSERMNVLSCCFENGGRLHIVCSNLSYEQFMFVEDERQVVQVLRNYVPYAGPLHFDGDTSPAVAVVAHVNHAQRVVRPKTDV